MDLRSSKLSGNHEAGGHIEREKTETDDVMKRRKNALKVKAWRAKQKLDKSRDEELKERDRERKKRARQRRKRNSQVLSREATILNSENAMKCNSTGKRSKTRKHYCRATISLQTEQTIPRRTAEN